jgi:hypothetical protein
MPPPDGRRLVFMEFNTLEGRIPLLSLTGRSGPGHGGQWLGGI